MESREDGRALKARLLQAGGWQRAPCMALPTVFQWQLCLSCHSVPLLEHSPRGALGWWEEVRGVHRDRRAAGLMLWDWGVCGQWGISCVTFPLCVWGRGCPELLPGPARVPCCPWGTSFVSPLVPAQPSPPGSPELPGAPGSPCRHRSFPIQRPDEGKQ